MLQPRSQIRSDTEKKLLGPQRQTMCESRRNRGDQSRREPAGMMWISAQKNIHQLSLVKDQLFFMFSFLMPTFVNKWPSIRFAMDSLRLSGSCRSRTSLYCRKILESKRKGQEPTKLMVFYNIDETYHESCETCLPLPVIDMKLKTFPATNLHHGFHLKAATQSIS